MDKDSIGKRISVLRKAHGLTQKELAEKLSISNKTVSRWETDEGYPDVTILSNVAKALETTTDYLLYGKDEKTSVEKEHGSELFFRIALLCLGLMILHFISWGLFYLAYKAGMGSESFGKTLSYIGVYFWSICPIAAGIGTGIDIIFGVLDKNKKKIKRGAILLFLAVVLRIVGPMIYLTMTVVI